MGFTSWGDPASIAVEAFRVLFQRRFDEALRGFHEGFA